MDSTLLLKSQVAGILLSVFAFSMTLRAETATNASTNLPSVILSDTQVKAIQKGRLGEHSFVRKVEALGSIDFNEDATVQIFPNYQGKIIKTFAKLGDTVHEGEPLFTVDSPDLLQAESTLIGAAAVLDLTSKELTRAQNLYKTGEGVAQRELEQATSDQQSAEGALKSAREIVGIFGKSEGEIDQIIASRTVDGVLVVKSPVNGKVTARNAQPGLLVQPGVSPAPYTVSDLSHKWLVANVSEINSPLLRMGQKVSARVMALPGHDFEGHITAIDSALDPNTHRLMVRSEILDSKNELRPGMMANFVIEVGKPKEEPAIPVNGVVRNGDGTMAAWVTADGHHFTQHIIKVGQQSDGLYRVIEGLTPGETVVTDGAVFLNNMLQAPVDDD